MGQGRGAQRPVLRGYEPKNSCANGRVARPKPSSLQRSYLRDCETD